MPRPAPFKGQVCFNACGQFVGRYPGVGLCDSCYVKRRRSRNPDHFRMLNNKRNANYLAKRPGLSALRHRLKRYGLTVIAYDALLARQHNQCQICLRHMARPCVDHDHSTGKVRGLLCTKCNSGIALLTESGFVMARAVAYLKMSGTLPADDAWHETYFVDLPYAVNRDRVIQSPSQQE